MPVSSIRGFLALVSVMSIVVLACGGPSGDASDGEVLNEPATTASGSLDDVETKEGRDGSGSAPEVVPEPVGDETEIVDSPSAVPDVLLQVELAEFVVRASRIHALEPYTALNRSDEMLTLRPFDVHVDEVVWTNVHVDHHSDATPRAGSVNRAIEVPSQDAVSLAVEALASESQVDTLIVGLASLPSAYTDGLDEEFSVMFVAVPDSDGGWSFPGFPEEARAPEVVATLMDVLGADGPLDALDRYAAEIGASNAAGAPTALLREVHAAVTEVLRTEPTWAELRRANGCSPSTTLRPSFWRPWRQWACSS